MAVDAAWAESFCLACDEPTHGGQQGQQQHYCSQSCRLRDQQQEEGSSSSGTTPSSTLDSPSSPYPSGASAAVDGCGGGAARGRSPSPPPPLRVNNIEDAPGALLCRPRVMFVLPPAYDFGRHRRRPSSPVLSSGSLAGTAPEPPVPLSQRRRGWVFSLPPAIDFEMLRSGRHQESPVGDGMGNNRASAPPLGRGQAASEGGRNPDIEAASLQLDGNPAYCYPAAASQPDVEAQFGDTLLGLREYHRMLRNARHRHRHRRGVEEVVRGEA